MRELISLSLTDPSRAAAELLRRHYPLSLLLQAGAALAVMSTIVGYLTMLAAGVSQEGVVLMMSANPLYWALMLFAIFVLMSYIIYGGGKALGGTGTLNASMLVMVWLSLIQLIIQVVQFVLITVSPFLAQMLSMIALGWFLWALTQFVKLLHGFDNGVMVFFGILVAFFISMMVASFLLIVLGVVPEEMMRGV